MSVTKSTAGEIVVDSPWAEVAQLVQGISFFYYHMRDRSSVKNTCGPGGLDGGLLAGDFTTPIGIPAKDLTDPSRRSY